MIDSYQRNELLETVERYTSYTAAFQEWLMKAAIQRGVENTAQIVEQAKQKQDQTQKGKKIHKLSTAQHEFLVDGIADSKRPHSKLIALIGLISVMLKSHDLEDDASTFTIVRFNGDDSDSESDSKEQGHAKLSKSSKRHKGQPTTNSTSQKKRPTDNPLSNEEINFCTISWFFASCTN